MNISDHRGWHSLNGGGWQLVTQFDTFRVILTRTLESERLRAILEFNYEHGATGGVLLTKQTRSETDQDFIDRVVEEHLNELEDRGDCDQFIGEYAM